MKNPFILAIISFCLFLAMSCSSLKPAAKAEDRTAQRYTFHIDTSIVINDVFINEKGDSLESKVYVVADLPLFDEYKATMTLYNSPDEYGRLGSFMFEHKMFLIKEGSISDTSYNFAGDYHNHTKKLGRFILEPGSLRLIPN